MTTQNSTTFETTRKAVKVVQKSTKPDPFLKKFEKAWKKLDWFGRQTIMVISSTYLEGDPALYDYDDFEDLIIDLKYGKINDQEFMKAITHIWAHAVGFKCTRGWPYYAE